MSAQAGPSVSRVTEPGVLDRSQHSRLLRHPNATLSFASFDPYVATPIEASGISKLSLQDDKCRPKRIVIETIPGHGSSWRWVPSARREDGVQDEGSFPRSVEICGQVCECTQDQWDIYKLDPLYDCLVRQPPALTVIAKKTDTYAPPPDPLIPTNLFGGEEGYDSESMSVDDDVSFLPGKGRPLSRNNGSIPLNSTSTVGAKPKRPAHLSFQSLRPGEEDENDYLAQDVLNRNTTLYAAKNQKRARTLSPETGRKAMYAHRSKRENMKSARRREEMESRKAMREQQLMDQLRADIPPQSNQHGHMPDIPEDQLPEGLYPDQEQPPEFEDPVTASLRKMAELNADRERERLRERELGAQPEIRPSARADQLRAEAERRRAAEEALRRKAEEEARLREQQEAQRAEQGRRKRAELLAQVERERRQRNDQWLSGPWTTARAIERYKTTCIFFDKARFSEETYPLAFIDIPWPSLRHPVQNRPQDVDWQSTHEFFSAVKPILRGQAYRDFIKQSLQRFHPDRWSSRNLFSSIVDEDERNEVDTAVNTVSKALGALYAEARSSS